MRKDKKNLSRTAKKTVNDKKKRKISLKLLIGFIAFELVFTVATAPFVLLYGPFEEAKVTYVGAAMATMNNQWLATTFLSQDKIAEILGTNKATVENEAVDNSLVNIPKSKDDSIEYYILQDNPKFTGHALVIHDPTRVKLGYSSKLGKEGETVSQIAEHFNAVAAINGGAFTDEANTQLWTSNGGIPVGLLMSEGKIIHDDLNGASTSMAAFTAEGRLLVGNYTTSQLKSQNVKEAMSFGPALVINGRATSLPGSDGGQGTSPRTMIGQRKDGSVVMVVLDSKIPGSRVAATLVEAQEVMLQLDCITATNLDGGKSATMYLNGEVINNPSYALGERPIASGFVVV